MSDSSSPALHDGMVTLIAILANSGLAQAEVVEALCRANVHFVAIVQKAVVEWDVGDCLDLAEYPVSRAAFPGELPFDRYTGYVKVPAEVVRQLAGLERADVALACGYPGAAPSSRGFYIDAWPEHPSRQHGALATYAGDGEDGEPWVCYEPMWLDDLNAVRVPEERAGEALRPGGRAASPKKRARSAAVEHLSPAPLNSKSASEQGKKVRKLQWILAGLVAVCTSQQRDPGKRGLPTAESIAGEVALLLESGRWRQDAYGGRPPGLEANSLRQRFGKYKKADLRQCASEEAALAAALRLALMGNRMTTAKVLSTLDATLPHSQVGERRLTDAKQFLEGALRLAEQLATARSPRDDVG